MKGSSSKGRAIAKKATPIFVRGIPGAGAEARRETPHDVTDFNGDEFICDRHYEGWRPQGSGDWQLIYTKAGCGRITGPRGTADVQAGDVILWTPDDPQDYRTAPHAAKWHNLWCDFIPRPHLLLWLQWPQTEVGLKIITLKAGEVRRQFESALMEAIAARRRHFPGSLDFAFNALERALLWAGVAVSGDKWLAADERIRKAIDFMVIRLYEPFSLPKLARHSGLSISRFSFLFKQQTGLSPQQFLEWHRLKQARQLLRLTRMTVSEIAAQVGFNDAFYFSSRFHRFFGESPSEFRSQTSKK